MKQTKRTHRRIILVALAGVALLTPGVHVLAQTVTAQFGDLILGFRASGAPGQSLNLEVDLGSMSNFYGLAAGTTVSLPALALQDLANTYGSSWYTRTDLWWGAIATTGRASGTPDGHAPVDTLWASRAAGGPPWNRAGKSTQATSSAVIEPVITGDTYSLDGASSTTNSSESAIIDATQPGSWSIQEASTPGESFNHFNPTIDNLVTLPAAGDQVISALYELQPTNSGGVAGTFLGNLVLTRSGLSFQSPATTAPSADFTAAPLSGPAPLTVSFADMSGSVPQFWSWTFGDGGLASVENPTYTYLTPGSYTAQLLVSNAIGSSTFTQTINVYDPYAWWALQYYGSTNIANAAPGADPFGTGMNNTNKFLAGFATNSTAYLHIISLAKTNGTDIKVFYLGANGDNTYTGGPASRTNVLEYTTGTANGSYSNNFVSTGQTNILSGGTGLGAVSSMVDSGGATNRPSRFYRVRVLLP
ncbi:MAG TPA: PKD domain-containing protein [Verrucomicrobiae bacterium]|nr:PKD domain-containing protein [Verrucomicrobiae bacterium]